MDFVRTTFMMLILLCLITTTFCLSSLGKLHQKVNKLLIHMDTLTQHGKVTLGIIEQNIVVEFDIPDTTDYGMVD